MCAWVFFSVAAELCLLPHLLLGVGWALVEPLLVWLLYLSWGTCGFPQRVLQLVALLGFRTYLAPVSWPTPAVDVYCWVGGVLVHLLVFYLVPAQLPLPLLTLSGFCNLSGYSLLVSSCSGDLLWAGSVFDASLDFLPGAVLFLRGLQLALLRVPLGIFRSPGVCPSASLVT